MTNSKRKSHCNKKAFPSLLAAQIGLKRTLSSNRRRGNPIVTGLSVYKCLHCSAWHVGRSLLKGIDWRVVEALEQAQRKRIAEWVARKHAQTQSGED